MSYLQAMEVMDLREPIGGVPAPFVAKPARTFPFPVHPHHLGHPAH